MCPNAVGRWGGSCGVSANEYSCAHVAQINFGDITPYLTYGILGRDGYFARSPITEFSLGVVGEIGGGVLILLTPLSEQRR